MSSRTFPRHLGRALALGLLLLLAVEAGVIAWLNVRGEAPLPAGPDTFQPTTAQVERGAYLALAGNCAGCHTARGGAPYAGGRAIETPFGVIHAGNLTPDATGLGNWTAAAFWRAMHHGRSLDGRLLYPAFPYPNTTQVSRADSDAIYAYLRSLPPVAQVNRPHELRFPFNTQAALAVWRALYFQPGEFQPDTARSAEWNRGAYLVQGLGHCNACHAHRNALGGTTGPLDLGGGLIPVQNWYAPSLTDSREAGVAEWTESEIVALLKAGVVDRHGALAVASGPMGEVVLRSTQHLSDADLGAMAVYLKTLGQAQGDMQGAAPATVATGLSTTGDRGATLYADHCASCHGERGEGISGAYPALAGNRAVTMAVPANLVRIVLEGGFAPATAGNPQPYGMPPFAQTFSNDEVAAVLTHLRRSWGNSAEAVTPLDVLRYRESGAR